MTAANVFVPKSSDARLAEARAQEPSMEDILASIRRIIADDQLQASRPGYGGPRRVVSSPGADAPASERALVGKAERSSENPQSGYDDILDLARIGRVHSLEPAPAPYVGRPTIDEEAALATPTTHEATVPPDAGPMSADEAEGQFDQAAPFDNDHAQPPGIEAGYGESHGDEPEPEPKAEHAVWANDGPQVSVASTEDSPVGDALMSPALGASVMSAFETLAATVVLQNTEMLERIMRELLRPLVKTWLDENLPTLVERLVRNEIERVARGGRA